MAQQSVTKCTLDVSGLGSITGIHHSSGTCQFLGIPYATIPGRFRRCRPGGPWPCGRHDGTQLGPYCPQPPRDFYPIPLPERPWLRNPGTSELHCLNLNINVPFLPTAEGNRKQLFPVMVFIHGGAFAYAAGSAAIYDGRELVRISVDQASPTVVVTINYRLGIFGFLASHAIRDYNHINGEDGVGNYGLWDQVEALRWVQMHIHAFGGDKDRVTIFGQSAGGVSVNAHLLRNEPLFSSAVLQSGLLPLCGMMTVDEYDVVYEKTLSVLGIPQDIDPGARLDLLLQANTSSLVESMIPVFMAPVVTLSVCTDGGFLPPAAPSYSSFDTFRAPQWCTRLMLGDAASETIIWNKTWRSRLDSPDKLVEYSRKIIGSNATDILFSDIYPLSHDLNHPQTFDFIEKFTTDALYLSMNYDLCRSVAQQDSTELYYYHFDEPSTYNTEWKGRAHHSLENVFVWSLLNPTLDSHQQIQSHRMASMWLKFANGQPPWENFSENQQIQIFGSPSSGEACLKTAELDAARGYARWAKVREAGLTEAWGVLADNICMLRRDLVSLDVQPYAIEAVVPKASSTTNDEPGVL